MAGHEEALAAAFDGQSAMFERAPVQTDPAALARLVKALDAPADALVLDTGCGPGLVSEALLKAGYRVVGWDLSAEMVRRARARCEAFGGRASFEQRSLFDDGSAGPFDAVVSRYVVHHTPDASAFVRRQVEFLKPGGILLVCDHTTDPEASAAHQHQAIEKLRDQTHTRNLTPGELVDVLAGAGLGDIRVEEEAFTLDFDEWFDRGTPGAAKEVVRRMMLDGPGARGFRPEALADGAVRLHCWRALVRGVKA